MCQPETVYAYFSLLGLVFPKVSTSSYLTILGSFSMRLSPLVHSQGVCEALFSASCFETIWIVQRAKEIN